VTGCLPAPRGDLLSCFGTAVAHLLGHVGQPYLIFMGCQLATGVRHDGDIMEFRHYHTPLMGRAPGIVVSRHRAYSAEDAAAGILAELDRSGAVVLTGTNDHLPWVDPGELDIASHWVFASRRPGAGRGIRVSDPFTWIDDAGEHHGYVGVRSEGQIACLAEGSALTTACAISRDRWAFGSATDRPDGYLAHGWYWLAADEASPDATLAADPVRTLLSRTARLAPRHSDTEGGDWHWDEDAFEMLAEFFENGRDDPVTYVLHNDLWVVARSRALFATALAAQPVRAVLGDLSGVIACMDGGIIPAWNAVLKLLRYNAGRMARGRPPRAGVGPALNALAGQERELRLRLQDALRG
jgi:hypothetical protein